MFRRLLIANRGEIAARIIRTCESMGIKPVTIYTHDDINAFHVRQAAEGYALEGPSSAYLDAKRIVQLAIEQNIDAIHPGYGFLSEEAAFAEEVQRAGITWIGPRPEIIALFANKDAARDRAIQLSIPTIPGTLLKSGSEGTESGAACVEAFGNQNGWPVVLKSVAGGGGRGIRVVRSPAESAKAITDAVQEARKLFSDPRMIVEKYIENARHIEVQMLADKHGTVQAIGNRDCSVQRRRQKLIEEAPAPQLNSRIAQKLADAAIRLFKEVGYVGAGTVEFLVCGEEYYFLEVNPRIQVEHPVTEQVFARDLIADQIRVSAGERLPQAGVNPHDQQSQGHAIEVRINAEDPDQHFRPMAGKLSEFEFPQRAGLRVDAAYEVGDMVSTHFDGLMAKIIVHAENRATAIRELTEVLDDIKIDGVPNTSALLREVLIDPSFMAGETTTQWLEENLEELLDRIHEWPEDVVVIAGRPVRLAMASLPSETGRRRANRRSNLAKDSKTDTGTGDLRSPMIGVVAGIHVEPGAQVAKGDPLVSIEAMKLENLIRAEQAHIVDEVNVVIGEQVISEQILLSFRK